MQLFLLIALLLASGKGGESLYSQVKPVLECFGGEEVKQAFKSAEEFKGVLTALGGMDFGGNAPPQTKNDSACGGESDGTYASTNSRPNQNTRTYGAANRPSQENTHTYASVNQSQCKNTPEYGKTNDTAAGREEGGHCGQTPPFAMAPVVRLADREIIYRLAQYFSEGASG